MKGKLIVLEGIDGAGKSTLAKNLYKSLLKEGRPSILTFEPTKGRYGAKLRESFLSKERLSPEKELELFVLDRKEHLRDVVLPALKEGKIVICDRYYFSTIAYQGARGMDTAKIRKINEEFAPPPHLLFIVELEPEEAVLRIKEKRGEAPNSFEGLKYLKRVDFIFKGFPDPFIERLDGALSEEKLLEAAFEKVHSLLKGDPSLS